MRRVEIGERYQKVGGPKQVWAVERLVADLDGIRHFQLRDLKDPSRTMVISERALVNRRYFQLVETL